MRLAPFFLAACAAATVAGAARADVSPADEQLAQSLFDRARELMDQSNYAEACPKLEESQRLDPGGGTLLNLAICHEYQGRLATAWTELNVAFSQALREGRRDREQTARDHMAALAPRLPHLVVDVPKDVEALAPEVTVDGAALRRPAWGTQFAIDPGKHTVAARLPGKRPFSTTIAVSEAGGITRVTVPPFEDEPPLPAPPAPAPVVVAPGPLPPMETAPPPTIARPHVLFYPALTVALAGLGTSAVTGAMALAARSEAKEGCLPERQFCASQSALDAASNARTLAWVSTATLAVGLGAGVLAIALPRQRVPVVAAARPFVAPIPGGAALGLGGSLF